MSKLISDTQTISLKLSEVLGDIGLTEKMVIKRRRIFMLMETIDNATHRLLGEKACVTFYNFGSQTEGSTTMELDSDIDTLLSLHFMNVIQDLSEWKFGVINLQMIQDESTSPGYCLLQVLRPEVPLPYYNVRSVLDVDRKGRPLLKNSCFDNNILSNQFRNGPANTFKERPGYNAEDNVLALYFESLPAEARPWLVRQSKGGWPTEEMKRYCETTGCFLVPVGSKSGQNQKTEWRISTSLAERCLMFNLNITQIRCYVLMKMILKTFINPRYDGVLSSFMCKTVLFYCIENTQSNEWVEHNLLACLKRCLLELHNCITQENCPHFITPENNLLAGKLSPQIRCRLLEILQKIIQSEGAALLEISIDDLGMRLEEKMNTIPARPAYQHSIYESRAVLAQISAKLLKHIARQLAIRHKFYLSQVMYDEKQIINSRLLVCTLAKRYVGNSLSSLEKAAYRVVIPLLCSSLASAIASRDMRTNRTISKEALGWFSAGLNSDVSSGRLKFASALYCAGDFGRAELILRNTEDIYDLDSVETVCTCRDGRVLVLRMGFFKRSNTGNEELVKQVTAFCVKFTPCEKNCVPKEMQYEMFRSTKEEMLKRDKPTDAWMDWSVVDSLPYLYFLQYKTYDQLKRTAGKNMALANLINCTQCALRGLNIRYTETILIDMNLAHVNCPRCTLRGLNIRHTETALNLLGQCLEQENRFAGAFECYVRSVNIRETNNVAKIHICRLLNLLINRKTV